MTRLALLLLLAAPLAAAQPFSLVGAAPAAGGNPHGAIAIACEACHTSGAWRPLRERPAFDHDRDAGFALEGRHRQTDCASCHLSLRFEATPDDCQSCHLDVHRGTLGADCQTCHTPTDFALVRGADVHARSAFPLTGSHLQVACADCHAPGAGGALGAPLGALPTDCVACHADDYAGTADGLVDHAAAGFPTDCETCHTTVSFAGGTGFDHAEASGGFALVGAHLPLPCSACHTPTLEPLFAPAGADDCLACHAADADAATPSHAAYPTTCTTCHTTQAWAGATGDHVVLSGGFELRGAHAALACATCHTTPDFGLPWTPAGAHDCQSCHADDAAGATPPHTAFPSTCATCHTDATWAGATLDHPAVSGGFDLIGAHATVACRSCHSNPDYSLPWTPADAQDCQSCHADDAAGATPPHTAFPTTCTTCHTTTAWAGATVDHPEVSGGFTLVGTHATLACTACHSNPDFSVPWTPAGAHDCQSCHADDATGAQPDHASFPTTCTTCHGTTTWAGATLDHPTVSGGFPLLGAHATVACRSCHSNPDYSLPWTPADAQDCQSCHEEDAAGATPPHTSFPSTCTTCHTTTTWAGATLDHPTVSGGFTLVGAHAAIACTACHSNPDFSLPWSPADDQDCESCHADDAKGATPPHASFPTTCTTCHGTTTWAGASVDHPAVSGGFTLVGAHAPLPCTACHSNPDFSVPWTPAGDQDCVSCHADDASAATPPHTAFPTTCTTCHGTTTWAGATVDHPTVSGGFALVGAHATIACTACHSNPDYSLPWTPAGTDDCLACHQPDYDANHAGTGFPTTCLDCHTTTTWEGATVTHPQFPIYSGRHAGEWDSCQTCHTQPGDFSVFSCLTCHEHNQADMDDEHEDVGGYSYNSDACYSCHPDGREVFGPVDR